jgi:hypothetical protein
MAKDSFVFRCDYIEKLSQFSTEELGVLVKALSEYVKDGVIPEIDKGLMIAFNMIKVDVDKDIKKYEERCRINKEIADNRWNEDK